MNDLFRDKLFRDGNSKFLAYKKTLTKKVSVFKIFPDIPRYAVLSLF